MYLYLPLHKQPTAPPSDVPTRSPSEAPTNMSSSSVVTPNPTSSPTGSPINPTNNPTVTVSPPSSSQQPTDKCQICGSADASPHRQSDYCGTIATTVNGRTCQRWDSQFPHEHSFSGDFGSEDNYCRNPDGEPSTWCYTTDPDKRWELCAVPFCENITASPTGRPSADPSKVPTLKPVTSSPSKSPSSSPMTNTSSPSANPSKAPTLKPVTTESPTTSSPVAPFICPDPNTWTTSLINVTEDPADGSLGPCQGNCSGDSGKCNLVRLHMMCTIRLFLYHQFSNKFFFSFV